MAEKLPNKLEIAFANGEKIISDNGQTYYDYFNTSLRWLCGYNNEFIGNKILSLSNTLKKDPNYYSDLFNNVNSFLVDSVKKDFNFSIFLENTTIDYLDKLYSIGDKFPILLTNNEAYQKESRFKNFLDLITLEKDSITSKKTPEGWSKAKIKKFFKHYKKQISLFVLSPLLLHEGFVISEETVQMLYNYCKKYKIPFIWDESYTCFFRTGTFFFLNQFNIKPDFICIDTNVYQNKKIHLLICSKKIKRKYKKELNSIPNKKQAINLILLESIFDFFESFKIKEYVETISYRLKHKLIALSSNLKNKFEFKTFGLLTLLNLNNINYAKKFNENLNRKNVIFYYNNDLTFIFIPQIIMTTHSVDLFIQFINDFFRDGIKLQKLKQED